jgi:hypothetical protein
MCGRCGLGGIVVMRRGRLPAVVLDGRLAAGEAAEPGPLRSPISDIHQWMVDNHMLDDDGIGIPDWAPPAGERLAENGSPIC